MVCAWGPKTRVGGDVAAGAGDPTANRYGWD